LQLTAIVLGDLAAQNHGDLVGLTDGEVGVQESLPQGIEGSSAMENEIIAILDLSKEQTMLTTGLFALLFREEGSEAVQPLATADQQIVRGQRIGEFLKPLGVRATQEGIGGLLSVLLLHAAGEPVMLVETDACRKRKIGGDANEHSAPVTTVQVEVVLNDPALSQLQVPAIVLLVPDVSRSDRSQRRYGRVRAATSWVLSIALIFSDRTKGPSDSTGEAQYRLSNSSLFRRLSLSDLEGRSRGASRALRPVLMAARRIEPFLRTGLPLLPRGTTKNLFETRGCYPDDR
jgi:hypothetical protein